jgi:hypothetical protein
MQFRGLEPGAFTRYGSPLDRFCFLQPRLGDDGVGVGFGRGGVFELDPDLHGVVRGGDVLGVGLALFTASGYFYSHTHTHTFHDVI